MEEQSKAGVPACFDSSQIQEIVDYYSSQMSKSVEDLNEMLQLVEKYCDDAGGNLSKDELKIFKEEVLMIRKKVEEKQKAVVAKIKEMGTQAQCN